MKKVTLKRYPLGNKRFIWKQEDFALSTFNCVAYDMDLAIRNCKEVGFNYVELGWGPHDKVWEAVDLCEKYELNLIFQDLSLLGGMMHRHLDRPVTDDTIREVAKKLRDKKYTVGYYVWDEPYNDELFAKARHESDILEECDPEALLFSVFPPSYNPGPTWDNGQYLNAFEEFVKQVEPPVLSMDCYPIGNYCGLYEGLVYTDDKQLDNSPMWLDLTVARNLARKYELPFWFYYQACSVYKTENLTFPMVRMMMYAGTLYGAKGLQNYTATGECHMPKDEKSYPTKWTTLLLTGEKGEFFDDLKDIHAEFVNLGKTLMALSNKAVYHSNDLVLFGKYEDIYKNFKDDIANSDILEGTLPNRTSVGELCDDYGNNYLFVLNRDFYKELDASIPLKGKFNVYEVSKTDGTHKLVATDVDTLDVKLTLGDAVLYRVQPASEEPVEIEYAL